MAGISGAARSLSLPAGETEESLRLWLETIVTGYPDPRTREEFSTYLHTEFRRFFLTLGLVPEGHGRLLEVGAAPYFTTALLRSFRGYELHLTNGFGNSADPNRVSLPVRGGSPVELDFSPFNLEVDPPPLGEGSFDVVLCCEVIEHMTADPVGALANLNRALRLGGCLVLTTPNAARLGAVVNALAGVHSMHDQYSAYGPYGRHNREYTPGEMEALLHQAGFEIEEAFTSDVVPSARQGPYAALRIPHAAIGRAVGAARWVLSRLGLLPGKPAGLGAYMFFRARKARAPGLRRPGWLYRSYDPDAVEDG